MLKTVFMLSSLLGAAAAFGAAEGEAWSGRAAHPAVVNPVCRPADDPDTLSLDGEWTFTYCDVGSHRGSRMPEGESWWWVDEPERVRPVRVPGCWEANAGLDKEGESIPWASSWDSSRQKLRCVHSGEGWYKRTVRIPAAWAGKRIWLKTGWVNSKGWFWVNGRPVAIDSNYCGTYKYDVTDCVRPGEDALVVVEAINTLSSHRGCFNFVNRWGGIIRSVEFEATPMDCWIDDAWVDCRGNAHVELCGATNSCRVVTTMPDNLRVWSPEHPNLHTARVELVSADGRVLQTRYERFGLRKFERRGSDLYLNDRPFFARGAGWHDILPIEGAAPGNREYWLERARKVKAAGFNYIRLHTTCRPPEFFEACDEVGLMVQAELPYYTDVPSDGQRFDPLADAEELYLNYRRHPSFVTYSGGNEGTFRPLLARRLYDEIKARDPDRLVTAQDNYPNRGVDRSEWIYNLPGTSDFADAETTVWPRGAFRREQPFIAHEYLNLAVKLDSKLEKRFTGVWKAPITRKARAEFLEKCGLSMELGDRLQVSQHRLQSVWRKYGLESARLDTECDGYSYWSLQDVCVPNRGIPAAQALFDPFFGVKEGGDTPADVAVYNSPSCVLLRDGEDPELWKRDPRSTKGWHSLFADSMATNRVRRSGETIRARFYLAHYGEEPMKAAVLEWALRTADGRTLASGSEPIGDQALGAVRKVFEKDIPVPELGMAEKAVLSAAIGEVKNSWDYWLMPAVSVTEARAEAEKAGIVICEFGSEAEKTALKEGKRVIALANQTGRPNIQLGWWWMGSQMGSVVLRDPLTAYLPHDGVFNQLFFRIGKEGLKLPVEGFEEKDLVMVGEGHENCYLYLARRQLANGAREVLVAGLDVTNDTPEGAAILRGAVNALHRDRKPFAEIVPDSETDLYRTMKHPFPKLRKNGAVSPYGECSPFVFKGRLMRMELIDPSHGLDSEADIRIGIRDVESGRFVATFRGDTYFPAAYVENDRVYITATKRTYWQRGERSMSWACGDLVAVFESDDLVHWTERTLFERPGWCIFNTTMTRGPEGYVIAYEVGDIANAVHFTMFFATSKDLKEWKLMPDELAFPKNRYCGGPFLVYRNGWYYLALVTEMPCQRYCTYLYRTRDFTKWECGRYNPCLMWDDDDRRVAPKAADISPELAAAIGTGFVCNASDLEMCDFEGRTYMNYLIGDQHGFYYMVEAWYDGPMQEYLERQFE